MRLSLRQSMASLHTWSGLLPGWICFAIFLFGSAAFFNQEISQWMRPELRAAPVSAGGLDAAGALLERRAAGAEMWRISLPGERGGSGLSLSWAPREGSNVSRGQATLDPRTGQELAIRESRGGSFLYNFHYELHYLRWLSSVHPGRLLICIASLAMLVAILSGVITHKKIFADFFLLRFGKGQRSWLDAHNVTAVLALPFHLMITYTGLVTLLFTLMPWAISANFPDKSRYYEATRSSAPDRGVSGVAAPILPLSSLVTRAMALSNGAAPRYIEITYPGDTNAIASLWPDTETLAAPRGVVRLDATTGEALPGQRDRGGASFAQDVMIDVHAGRFAGPVLRWLYFLSGIGGTMMIASGLVLWTVKRRAKLPDPAHPPFGFRLVERLNLGVLAGAPAGIAVYFLSNRLLALAMRHRAEWEINSLFIAWGGLFAWTLARPAKRAWIEALAVCAALYALVPIISAATTTRGLIPSLIARDWVFVSFDLVMLATAVALAFAAWKVAKHTPGAAPRRVNCATAEAVP